MVSVPSSKSVPTGRSGARSATAGTVEGSTGPALADTEGASATAVDAGATMCTAAPPTRSEMSATVTMRVLVRFDAARFAVADPKRGTELFARGPLFSVSR